MKKRTRLTALLIALLFALSAAFGALAEEEEDEQDRYWRESGREYLETALYNGRGRTLSAAERSAFFSTYAVTMTNVLYYGGGYFMIDTDGSYSGRFEEYDEYNSWVTEFYGRFTNVVQLNTYTYALQTDNITFLREDYPEVMQQTMIFTIPGIRRGMDGALNYEIQGIAEALNLNPDSPLACYFITAFDSSPAWYSSVTSAPAPAPQPTSYPTELYGLAIQKLATRKGPGTQYEGGGTYRVENTYIKVLSRAWDSRNSIWWVKCEIPYKGQIRVLWTGYKRFDPATIPLDSIPIDSDY